jgi:outer membrane lipopolysaccharide assembly protein LptE/RlpB
MKAASAHRLLKPGGLAAGVLVLGAVLYLSGCAGYRLGSTLPPGINVVHIPTFVNKTSEPRLEIETTQATIREVQRDGTLSVSDLEKSDVVLNVSLIGFRLDSLRYQTDRTTTTEEYRLTITAALTLTSRATGEVMTSNTVRGEADFVPAGDLSSAKRDAMPVAARDLAHDIVESIVEYW